MFHFSPFFCKPRAPSPQESLSLCIIQLEGCLVRTSGQDLQAQCYFIYQFYIAVYLTKMTLGGLQQGYLYVTLRLLLQNLSTNLWGGRGWLALGIDLMDYFLC